MVYVIQAPTASVWALPQKDPIVIAVIGRRRIAFLSISFRFGGLDSRSELGRRGVRPRPEETVPFAGRTDQLSCILRYTVLVAIFGSVVILRIHVGLRCRNGIQLVGADATSQDFILSSRRIKTPAAGCP